MSSPRPRTPLDSLWDAWHAHAGRWSTADAVDVDHLFRATAAVQLDPHRTVRMFEIMAPHLMELALRGGQRRFFQIIVDAAFTFDYKLLALSAEADAHIWRALECGCAPGDALLARAARLGVGFSGQ